MRPHLQDLADSFRTAHETSRHTDRAEFALLAGVLFTEAEHRLGGSYTEFFCAEAGVPTNAAWRFGHYASSGLTLMDVVGLTIGQLDKAVELGRTLLPRPGHAFCAERQTIDFHRVAVWQMDRTGNLNIGMLMRHHAEPERSGFYVRRNLQGSGLLGVNIARFNVDTDQARQVDYDDAARFLTDLGAEAV